jgi:hypothetical protein
MKRNLAPFAQIFGPAAARMVDGVEPREGFDQLPPQESVKPSTTTIVAMARAKSHIDRVLSDARSALNFQTMEVGEPDSFDIPLT